MIRFVDAGEKPQAELDQMIATFSQQSAQVANSVAATRRVATQITTEKLEPKGKRLIPVISA